MLQVNGGKDKMQFIVSPKKGYEEPEYTVKWTIDRGLNGNVEIERPNDLSEWLPFNESREWCRVDLI
ncbi:18133_t:CDS:2 [Acaulospora morrowiae]|uniref:18133_t:CDS:1 n=1 Tax=Acaulospora morrowiae TaxID=94023 RepID=A0A9N9F1K0_9GLOM|nr:18133_t:CDS:2 [Acaulospora morrowiae]